MRTIKRSSQFKKDFKQAKANPRHMRDIDELLGGVVLLLAKDTPLPDNCRDHALTSNWSNYRECHLKPDLLLIYRKPDELELHLARLGSHSELFG